MKESYSQNYKILSLTCDNASANDAMVDHLENLLEEFPGSVNRTRCFAHILNLVAKSILKQFDSPKGEELEAALDALEDELEDEDETTEDLDEADDNVEDDNVVDGRSGMTKEEIKVLEESVKPVRTVLVKVCQRCYIM